MELSNIKLSYEQKNIFEKYLKGENIFLSGPGGSGKSELIRVIYNDAISKHKNIQVTALTGCAAVLLHCRATTLHSWAGIGLGKGHVDTYVRKIRQRPYARRGWCDTEILIVDEVSMMSEDLFDTLNGIGKRIRSSNSAFGGIQLIFSGDFYQLPPVGDKECPETTRFCFESGEWLNTFPKENHNMLTKIFRQSDNEYCNILNQIRVGRIKRKSIEILQNQVNKPMGKTTKETIIPTKLLPVKYLVDNINKSEITRLDENEHVYKLSYTYKSDKYNMESKLPKEINNEAQFMASNLMCNKTLVLKVGAQVMSVVNKKSDDGKELILCNGSRGVVTGFCSITDYPIVKFNNGLERIITENIWENEKNNELTISQIPLILAWALTIHKSQGCTLDRAEINIGSNIFECGQSYVALSRVKSLEGLYLTDFDYQKIKVNTKVIEFYNKMTPTATATATASK